MSNASSHFLIVGDATDLAMVREILTRLPYDAYGQVFIEVASRLQIQRWDAPHGLVVTWLVRERKRVQETVPPAGTLAAAAARAWITEWMPEEREAHDLPYVLWIGCTNSPQMTQLYRELDERLESVHLHHPHHD